MPSKNGGCLPFRRKPRRKDAKEDPGEQPQQGAGVPGEAPVLQFGPKTEEIAQPPQAQAATDQAPQDGVHAMVYNNGQTIEYYESSAGIWLQAVISAKVREESDGGDTVPRGVYSVRLRGTGKRCWDVGFSYLRPPLQPDEPAELFNKDGEMWSQVTVRSMQSSESKEGFKAMSYEVKLGSSEVVEVSASLLRRYFPKGSKVLVYRGLERGWVGAEVVEPIVSDYEFMTWAPEEEPPDALGPPVSCREPSNLSALSADSQASAAVRLNPGVQNQQQWAQRKKMAEGKGLDCWMWVPIREHGLGSLSYELMPSYLIRLRPDFATLLAKPGQLQAKGKPLVEVYSV